MKKNYIYMSLLSVTMLLGSCKEEFFDLAPYNGVPVSTAITTEQELQAAVNGMYQSLRTPNAFGRNIPIMGDLLADNIYISPVNSGRYLTQNQYSTTAATVEPANMWAALYTSILRANTVINTDLPASTVVDQLKGEAYAVRALCHFYLVNYFATPYIVNPDAAGVPIVVAFDQNANPSRNTIKEVYNQVIADYDKAFTMITTAKNSSYLNKYAVKALQAKTYLFMGDYTKAREAALLVVNSGGYTLVPAANYVSYWAAGAPISTKVETLFEISLDIVNNNGSDALANMYDQNGYGDMLATPDLYNMYAPTDVRKNVIRVGNRGTNASSLIVTKYSNISSSTDRDDVKVMRYADLLLILAESNARLGNTTEALTYLNQVATTRGALPYASAGDQLILDILTERRKELAFEGHRYLDLQRLNLPVQRTTEAPATARTIAAGDPKRIQPIPQGERDANPNVAQNPGY